MIISGITIAAGFPRDNGQTERLQAITIPVFSKLTIEEQTRDIRIQLDEF